MASTEDPTRNAREPTGTTLAPTPERIRTTHQVTERRADEIWEILRRETSADSADEQLLLDAGTRARLSRYERNIENFIGTVELPVGVAGPLRIHGTHAFGDYYVPLATTEAALVASYQRGCTLITEAGGCTTVLIGEGVRRAPAFTFDSVIESMEFIQWIAHVRPALRRVAEATTRHGKLLDVRATVEGNHVYLGFEYSTGDAAGQNMVTIATAAVCDYVQQNTPVRPSRMFVEGNFTGDKKASALAFVSRRGRKVNAEVRIPGELIERRLHVSAHDMGEAWRTLAIGGVMSGTLGVHGHYANALAAIYIATGQDAATVSESAMGITRMELTTDGALYVSVTLPDLLVGTVGGGTGLPTQQACLRITNCVGPGTAREFAEVCVAVCLAGELSIVGAIAAGEFARAHERLARRR